MPTYEIKAPNGKTYRVSGPAGATTEQVRAEVMRQFPDAAGDTAPKPKQEERSVLGDLWASTKNAVAGAAQGAAAIPDAVTEGIAGVARYGVQGGGAAISGVLDAAGAPGAAKTVRRKTAEIDRDLSRPVTIGGMIEQISPTMEGGGAQRTAAQLMGGIAAPYSGIAKASTEGSAVQKLLAPKAPIKAPVAAAEKTLQREIVDAGKREGVRVMTSDVKPPKTFIGKTAQTIGERIPIAGTGGNRAKQQVAREEAVRGLLADFGATGDDAAGAAKDVAANLTKTRGERLSTLTNTKNRIIDKYVDTTVPVPNTLAAIDDQIERLKFIGNDDLKPVIAKLEGLKRTFSQGKILRDVEENRKIIGDMFKGSDMAAVRSVGEKAINKLYGPLRQDMAEFIKAKGGEAAHKTWKNANDELAAMAGELTDARFRRVLSNAETTPENVANMLFSKNASDVQRLFGNLSEAGQAKARAAILHRAAEKASDLFSLSPQRFAKEIDRLGKSAGVAFQGDDLVRLEGFSKLMQATQRASEAAAMPATGVQNNAIIGGYTLGTLFGKAALPVAGAMGFFARAYESAPVRNWLLKLGKASAGSPQERTAMVGLQKALVGAMASQRGKLTAAANDTTPAMALAGEEDKGPGVQ